MTKKLILASASPRRQELLEKTGYRFSVEVSDVDETVPEGMKTEEIPAYLSLLKAKAVFDKNEGDAVVIGSDTIVALCGSVFGKPADREDAVRMLKALSGKTHQVLTGVTILAEDVTLTFTESVSVTFFPMTDEDIEMYIATGEPFDKAGAYGIQGKGALFIKEISGDYYSVMGFPVARVYRELKKLLR